MAIRAAMTPITIHTGADIAATAAIRAHAAGTITEDQSVHKIVQTDITAFTPAITGPTAAPIQTSIAISPAIVPTTIVILATSSGFCFTHAVSPMSIGVIAL